MPVKTHTEVCEKIKGLFGNILYITRMGDPCKLEETFIRFALPERDLIVKVHYFHDWDESKKDDIECVLHLYYNNKKYGSYYGSFELMLSYINKIDFLLRFKK